jgi:hypothetical protein
MSYINITMQKQESGAIVTARCSHDCRESLIDFILEIDEVDYIKSGTEIASDQEVIIQFVVEEQSKIEELQFIFDSTMPEEPAKDPLFNFDNICLN